MKTCKDITELLSDGMERTLTPQERWAVRLHLMICRHCARFDKHIHFLRKAAARYGAGKNDSIHDQ
jgi:hypothetical protein